jgi:hypothetical protein
MKAKKEPEFIGRLLGIYQLVVCSSLRPRRAVEERARREVPDRN